MPTLPNFTDMAWQRKQSDEQIAVRIEGGEPPLMPVFRGKLPDEAIHWLGFYVRAFAIRSSDSDTSATAPTTSP